MDFTDKERTIIEAGSYIHGGRFEMWGPDRGIIKYLINPNIFFDSIFAEEAYEDPDGLMPLSIK